MTPLRRMGPRGKTVASTGELEEGRLLHAIVARTGGRPAH